MSVETALEGVVSRGVTEPRGLVELDGQHYRQHRSGGLVAITATVDETAIVMKGTRVAGYAHVGPSARLFGHAVVEDGAYLGPLVTLRDDARVGGCAHLQMGTIVRGEAYVGGASKITGCVIEGYARVIDLTISGAYTIR